MQLRNPTLDNRVWATFLVHGCRWTQAASGAAGRANVGLCPASRQRSIFSQSAIGNVSSFIFPIMLDSSTSNTADSLSAAHMFSDLFISDRVTTVDVKFFSTFEECLGRIACITRPICGLLLQMEWGGPSVSWSRPRALQKRLNRSICRLRVDTLKKPILHSESKKQDTKLLAITSPIIIRFSKFFHRQTLR